MTEDMSMERGDTGIRGEHMAEDRTIGEVSATGGKQHTQI
jgi:hypothetical protein